MLFSASSELFAKGAEGDRKSVSAAGAEQSGREGLGVRVEGVRGREQGRSVEGHVCARLQRVKDEEERGRRGLREREGGDVGGVGVLQVGEDRCVAVVAQERVGEMRGEVREESAGYGGAMRERQACRVGRESQSPVEGVGSRQGR